MLETIAGEVQVILTDKAAEPIGPYSQAIKAGGFVFVAGEKGINPQTALMDSGIQAQTRQTLENITVILEAAGVISGSCSGHHRVPGGYRRFRGYE